MQAQRNSLLLDRVSGAATFQAIDAVRVVTIEYDDRAFAFSGEQLEGHAQAAGGALPRGTRSPAALRDRLRKTRARMQPETTEPDQAPAQTQTQTPATATQPLPHSPQVELDWDPEGPETEIDLDEVVRTMRIPRDRLAVDAPSRDEESQVARVNQARPVAPEAPQGRKPKRLSAERPAPSLSFDDEPDATRRTRRSSHERVRTDVTTDVNTDVTEATTAQQAPRAREASAEHARPAQAPARSSSLPPPPPTPRMPQTRADDTQRTGTVRRAPTLRTTVHAAHSQQATSERESGTELVAHDELAHTVESWREPTQRTLHTLADPGARNLHATTSAGYPPLDRTALQFPPPREPTGRSLQEALDEIARISLAETEYSPGELSPLDRTAFPTFESTSHDLDHTARSLQLSPEETALINDAATNLDEDPWGTSETSEATATFEATETDPAAHSLEPQQALNAHSGDASFDDPAWLDSSESWTSQSHQPAPRASSAPAKDGARRQVPPAPPRNAGSLSHHQTSRSLEAVKPASLHARTSAADYDAMWDAVQPSAAATRHFTQVHALPPRASSPAFEQFRSAWQQTHKQKPWLIPAAASAALALAGVGAAVALRGPASFEVLVEVTPSDAQVSVDGHLISATAGQLRERLALGRHTLAVKKSGFESEQRVVSADQRGNVQQVRVSLTAQKRSAALSVSSIPSGAAIHVDGRDTGQTTPAALPDLGLGAHAVTLQLDGYASAEQAVRLPEDALVSISLVPVANKAPLPREIVRAPTTMAAPQLTEALLARRAQVRAARATCRQNARDGDTFDPEADSVLRAIGESCLTATTPAAAK